MHRSATILLHSLIAAAASICLQAPMVLAAPKAASSDSVMTDESAEKRILQKIAFDQKLDAELPLDLILTDEQGKQTPLRTYFGERPVLFVLAYYRCPMLCNQVLNGVLKSTNALEICCRPRLRDRRGQLRSLRHARDGRRQARLPTSSAITTPMAATAGTFSRAQGDNCRRSCRHRRLPLRLTTSDPTNSHTPAAS